MNILNKIPKKNEDLAWRVIDNETIVIDLNRQPEEGEELQVLNETATEIWKLIDSKNTVKDIIEKIINEYDIESDKVKTQIESLIKDLSSKKLITV